MRGKKGGTLFWVRRKLLTLGHLGLGWFIAGCVGQRGHEATAVDAASVTPRVFVANISWPNIVAPSSLLVERSKAHLHPDREQEKKGSKEFTDRRTRTVERIEQEDSYVQRLLGPELEQEIQQELRQRQEQFDRQVRQLNFRKRGPYEFFLNESSDGTIELYRRVHPRNDEAKVVIGPKLKGSPVLRATWNALQISDDGRRVALQTRSDSSGLQSLWIVDLSSKEFYEVAQEISFGGGAWATDNRHYLYGVSAQGKELFQTKVLRFDAETNTSDVALIPPNDCFRVHVSRTHSRQYLWTGLQCGQNFSIHSWPSSRPWQEPTRVRTSTPGRLLAFEHHVESYIALVESTSGDIQVERRSMRSDRSHWEMLISGKKARGYQRMEAFADYLVFWKKYPWRVELEFLESRVGQAPSIQLPETPYELFRIESQAFDNPDYRFGLKSPNQDLALFEYQVGRQKLIIPENVKAPRSRQRPRVEISRYQLERKDGGLFTLNVINGSSNQPAKVGLLIFGNQHSPSEFSGYASSREILVERGLAYAYLSAGENGGSIETKSAEEAEEVLSMAEDYLLATRFLNEMDILPTGGVVGIGSHGTACAVAIAVARDGHRFAGAWLHQPLTPQGDENSAKIECLPPENSGSTEQNLRFPPVLLSESSIDLESSEALEWVESLRKRRDYRSPVMFKSSRAARRDFELPKELLHIAYAFVLRSVGLDG